jgi:hypothetical protein
VDVVWLDVQMWTGLRGNFQPFTEVVLDAPDPVPSSPDEWQHWVARSLAEVAAQDGWQAGRYFFSAELRDDNDRTTQVLSQGQWEWSPHIPAALPGEAW